MHPGQLIILMALRFSDLHDRQHRLITSTYFTIVPNRFRARYKGLLPCAPRLRRCSKCSR